VEQDADAAEVEVLETRLELAQVVARGAVVLAHAAGRGRRLVRLEAAPALGPLAAGALRPAGPHDLAAAARVCVAGGGPGRGQATGERRMSYMGDSAAACTRGRGRPSWSRTQGEAHAGGMGEPEDADPARISRVIRVRGVAESPI